MGLSLGQHLTLRTSVRNWLAGGSQKHRKKTKKSEEPCKQSVAGDPGEGPTDQKATSRSHEDESSKSYDDSMGTGVTDHHCLCLRNWQELGLHPETL